MALARSLGDHRLMAEAATAFRASGVWNWREQGSTDDATVEVLLECLAHVSDLGLQARLWASVSMERYIGYDSQGADEAGRRSVDLARRSGHPDVQRACLESRCIALYLPGKYRELETCAREYLALGYPDEHEIVGLFHLANALHRQGRTAEADAAMDRAFAVAARLRHSGCDVPMAWWRWLRATERGDPDADEIAQHALALHRRTSVVGLEELTGLTVLERYPASGPVPADVVATAENLPHRSYRTYVAHALARRATTSGRCD